MAVGRSADFSNETFTTADCCWAVAAVTEVPRKTCIYTLYQICYKQIFLHLKLSSMLQLSYFVQAVPILFGKWHTRHSVFDLEVTNSENLRRL